jgi:hypothetical protein
MHDGQPLTGALRATAAKVCGSGRRDGSAGGRTKGWRRLTNSFDLREWWVRKSEYTWVRFGERRGVYGAIGVNERWWCQKSR